MDPRRSHRPAFPPASKPLRSQESLLRATIRDSPRWVRDPPNARRAQVHARAAAVGVARVCLTTGVKPRGPERSEGLVGFNGLVGRPLLLPLV